MVNRGDVVSCPDGAMAVFGFVGIKSWLEQRLTQSRWVATDSSVRKRLCWWIPSSGGKIHALLNCSVSLCRGGRCAHTHTHTHTHTESHGGSHTGAFKGTAYRKMKIQSLFTHRHAVPNHFSVKHKRRNFEELQLVFFFCLQKALNFQNGYKINRNIT